MKNNFKNMVNYICVKKTIEQSTHSLHVQYVLLVHVHVGRQPINYADTYSIPAVSTGSTDNWGHDS